MVLPAIIFDLDMTLLDTSALLPARNAGNWGYVWRNLGLARPFVVDPPQPAPHEIPGILRGLGHPVAIVTSSPRNYAEALLTQFNVPYDQLVAAGDTTRYKPDPEPLEKALELLGVAPADAYYVGDAKEDFEASYHAGIKSIGAGWNPEVEGLWKTAPDILLYHPGFLQRPQLLARTGYVAEVLAAGLTPFIHWGSVLRCDSPTRVALGRYFPSKDARYAKHPLTNRVLELKDSDGPSALFGTAVANYVKIMQPQPFYATCVPPKPQVARIRFAQTLQFMQQQVSGVSIVPDGLYATREVKDYKKANYDQRRKLIAGAYASKYNNWDSKHVLLLDDVLTSGATMDECADVLLANKAGSVHTISLSVDQHASARVCPRPECDGRLSLKPNRRYGTHFWGCSRWKKDKTGCNYTEDYIP